MMNKKNTKNLMWLEKEKIKDDIRLTNDKDKLINQIKQLGKDNILPKPPKKITLWQKIKRILLG
jgi:hypothetical protein